MSLDHTLKISNQPHLRSAGGERREIRVIETGVDLLDLKAVVIHGMRSEQDCGFCMQFLFRVRELANYQATITDRRLRPMLESRRSEASCRKICIQY